MKIQNGELEALIQNKINADVEFQDSLIDLSDEDKQTAVDAKAQELLELETLTLKEKAEQAAKAEELAKNYKIRAEKAEAGLKAKGEATPKNDLDLKDIRALNDVHDDDVDEVRDFAKYKGVSIAEAKKHPVIQTLLREHAEARKTAAAANTGGGQRGTTSLTDEQIISEAEKGKEIDPEELAEARLNVRIKNKK